MLCISNSSLFFGPVNAPFFVECPVLVSLIKFLLSKDIETNIYIFIGFFPLRIFLFVCLFVF